MELKSLNPLSSVNESYLHSLEHYGPVNSLKIFSNYVLAGYGPRLKVFKIEKDGSSLIFDKQVFSRNKIHVICMSPDGTKVFIGGSRSFSVFDFSEIIKNKTSIVEKRMNEWIISALFFNEDVLYVLNSHNTVLSIDITHKMDFKLIEKIHCNEKSILYSGSIQKVSDDKVLVAAGTVMNGVILWELNSRSIIHNLKTHEGSIFGVKVDLTGKYIISCSDDRSVQLSDASSGRLLATGWGHGSRIWNLGFFKDTANGVKILSVGEDCSVRVWKYNETDELLQTDSWEGVHLGKHIWASDVDDKNLNVIVTGGADGKIRLLDLQHRESAALYPLENIAGKLNFKCAKNEIIKQFFKFQNLDLLVCLTSKGNMFSINHNTSELSIIDSTAEERKHFDNFGLMKGCNKTNSLVVATHHGDLLLLSFKSNKDQPRKEFIRNESLTAFKLTNLLSCHDDGCNFYLLLDCPNPTIPKKLLIFDTRNNELVLRDSLLLENPNQSTFSATSMVVDTENNCLILGSRFSSLAIFDLSSNDLSIKASKIFKKITPGDTITSLSILSSKVASMQLLLTVRDEYYVNASIEWKNNDIVLHTMHINKLSKGFLEGGWYDNGDLILHGFKSSTFYIWNETKQIEIHNEVCGGSHRQWKLFHDEEDKRNLCFVYINKSILYIKHFKSRFKQSNYGILFEGTHGREIRSVAASPDVLSNNSRLIMTASEDSTIKLSTLDENGVVCNIWTMNNHVSGLQNVSFLNGEYAASSAANEEFFIWRINSSQNSITPLIQEFSRLPPQSASPDLRIMDFASLELQNGFLIATVYSDSNIRIWFFDTETQTFTIKSQSRYKTCCILNVEFLQEAESIYLVISSTDGFVTIWSLSNSGINGFSERMSLMLINQQIHQNGIRAMALVKEKEKFYLLTGGDDNALALSSIELQNGSIQFEVISYIESAASSTITSISVLPGNRIFVTSVDQIIRVWSYDDKLSCIAACYTTVADTGCSMSTRINSRQFSVIGGAGLSSWIIQ